MRMHLALCCAYLVILDHEQHAACSGNLCIPCYLGSEFQRVHACPRVMHLALLFHERSNLLGAQVLCCACAWLLTSCRVPSAFHLRISLIKIIHVLDRHCLVRMGFLWNFVPLQSWNFMYGWLGDLNVQVWLLGAREPSSDCFIFVPHFFRVKYLDENLHF
jgi:hypothetical protein